MSGFDIDSGRNASLIDKMTQQVSVSTDAATAWVGDITLEIGVMFHLNFHPWQLYLDLVSSPDDI